MKNNVLFVDDEVHILRAIKRGLYNEKFNKFFASSGDDALEIMRREDIHVIVTDMKMPRMTGLELLTIVKDEFPDTVKVILSGYTQLQQIIVTINRIDIYKFLTKPFDIEEEFKKVLYSAIELYNTRVENKILKESLAKKNEIYQKMIRTNSKKIDLVKSDFKFVLSYSDVMKDYAFLLAMKFKKDGITELKYKEEMAFIDDLYTAVVRKMPSVHREFDSGLLKKEINALTLNQADYKYELSISSIVGLHQYYGNFSLVIYTFFNMLCEYYVLQPDVNFHIAINERNYEDGRNDLLFMLKSSHNMIISDLLRIRSLKTFFMSLLEAYDGSFSFDMIDNSHLVMVRLPVTLLDTDGDFDD